MPGYAWGKGALLFALGSTSPSQHRLQTPIVCAGILYISEQFTDTVMYYLGNQPPSTALYGYRYLAQRLYRIIPRGVALYHAGAEYVQAFHEAPYASHIATISNAPLTPKRHPFVSTIRPPIIPWGSLVDNGISSSGITSGDGFMAVPRMWAVAAVEGWLEVRIKVK